MDFIENFCELEAELEECPTDFLQTISRQMSVELKKGLKHSLQSRNIEKQRGNIIDQCNSRCSRETQPIDARFVDVCSRNCNSTQTDHCSIACDMSSEVYFCSTKSTQRRNEERTEKENENENTKLKYVKPIALKSPLLSSTESFENLKWYLWWRLLVNSLLYD